MTKTKKDDDKPALHLMIEKGIEEGAFADFYKALRILAPLEERLSIAVTNERGAFASMGHAWRTLGEVASSLGYARGDSPDFGEVDVVDLRAHVARIAAMPSVVAFMKAERTAYGAPPREPVFVIGESELKSLLTDAGVVACTAHTLTPTTASRIAAERVFEKLVRERNARRA